jgi:hypothetical protein
LGDGVIDRVVPLGGLQTRAAWQIRLAAETHLKNEAAAINHPIYTIAQLQSLNLGNCGNRDNEASVFRGREVDRDWREHEPDGEREQNAAGGKSGNIEPTGGAGEKRCCGAEPVNP